MARVESGSHATGKPDVALTACLSIAVPLRIDELRRMTDDQRERAVAIWAQNTGDLLGSCGDVLLFRTRSFPTTKTHKYEPGTADAFNALARGLAAGAFAVGGIEFLGLRWCAGGDPA